MSEVPTGRPKFRRGSKLFSPEPLDKSYGELSWGVGTSDDTSEVPMKLKRMAEKVRSEVTRNFRCWSEVPTACRKFRPGDFGTTEEIFQD